MQRNQLTPRQQLRLRQTQAYNDRCCQRGVGNDLAVAAGRRGGRPVAITADQLDIARQARGESVTAIAAHLGVGRSTLYRALQPDDTTPPVS